MTYTASLYPDTYLFLTRPDDRLLDEAKSPGFGYLDRLICFSHFCLLSIRKNSCVVSPIVLEVSILVLIESDAVWRFCWALMGRKREWRSLLLFRRGEAERLRHRCVCSSPPSWRSSNNRTEASIESWLVSESHFQRDC